MCCNNSFLGGNACTWLLVLLILWIFCGNNENGLFGTANNSNNGYGCGC